MESSMLFGHASEAYSSVAHQQTSATHWFIFIVGEKKRKKELDESRDEAINDELSLLCNTESHPSCTSTRKRPDNLPLKEEKQGEPGECVRLFYGRRKCVLR